jgi:hypothetical protein
MGGVRPTSSNTERMNPRRIIPVRAGLALLCAGLVLLWTAPLAGQSVRGRVLDDGTGRGLAGVRIVLVAADGRAAGEAVSSSDGLFQLAVRQAGDYRVEASLLGYRTTTTAPFHLAAQEQLVVDVTLATAAIPLEPLVIAGRRRDPRHEPTVDGFYARQLLLPPIGSARAIRRIDPEMVNAIDARDVLLWLRDPRSFRGSGCLVVYLNGHMALSPEAAGAWLEAPAAMLEGIEYYREITDAPFPMRTIPIYLQECPRHSVIALWGWTGYYGAAPPPDLTPSPRRANVATGLYHLSGSGTPGMGSALEAAAHWPVVRGVALGLHARRSAHQLAPETTAAAVPEDWNWPYVVPPGRRPLTLWAAGIEPRLMLQRRGPVWPVLSARVQIAHRAFTLQSNSAKGFDVAITSWGQAVGVSAGGEVLIRERLAVHAAIGHDRFFFGPYRDIERRGNPTAARWAGTSLRVGVGYPLAR